MKKDNLEKIERIEKIERVENKFSKGVVAVAAVALLGSDSFAGALTATSDDSFGQLLGTFQGWLSGNLGKLLALLGFVGTFIIYLMTHKGSVLFIGIVISLVAGGISGITGTFFTAGTTAFA